MQSLITKIVSGKRSTYAAIISIFTYTFLLNRDLSCTCKPQASACFLYMLLPPFIIFFLILLLDSSFQSVCRYHCSHWKRLSYGLCCFYVNHFLKASLVSLLWVAFLLLDGDWYVCCQNDGSEQKAKLACIAEKDITLNEKVLKAELKNTSRFFGDLILFGIVLAAFVLPLCVRSKCWGKKNKHCFNKTFLYDKLIIIEEGKVLKELLRESAKEKVTEGIQSKIRENEWEKSFDVARELIEKGPPVSPTPTTAGPEGSTDQREQISDTFQYFPLDSYTG